MNFGQLIEYKIRNVFLKTHTENDVARLAPDLVLFFKKTLYEVKGSNQQLRDPGTGVFL